jgi:hypothetical protein
MYRIPLFLAALISALQPGTALAGRSLPEDAKFAHFAVVQHPFVTVDRESLRLAPGAQIRDEANRIVLPTSLQGKYRVLYTIDNRGDIFRVWILSPDELAQLKSRK